MIRGVSCLVWVSLDMNTIRRTIDIQTPEGIVFPLLVANPVERFAAVAIDQACIYFISLLLSRIVGALQLISLDFAGACFLILSFLISFGYPIAFEWFWQGQTIGKKMLRLRVMDEQGLRLHFSQIVIRNLMRIVDMLPGFYMVGGVSCMVSAHGQRLGDIAANTIVVHYLKTVEPDLEQLISDKYNSFREYPNLVARLRQSTNHREANVALQSLIRRNSLDDAARLVLFGRIRDYFQERVKFPTDVTEGISDEQYTRNIADVLFR